DNNMLLTFQHAANPNGGGSFGYRQVLTNRGLRYTGPISALTDGSSTTTPTSVSLESVIPAIKLKQSQTGWLNRYALAVDLLSGLVASTTYVIEVSLNGQQFACSQGQGEDPNLGLFATYDKNSPQ